MKLTLSKFPVVVLASSLFVPALAQDPPTPPDEASVEKVIEDFWGVYLLNGEETGWSHYRTVAIGEGETLLYRVDSEALDRQRHLDGVLNVRVKMSILEDAGGRMLELHDRIENNGEVVLRDLVVKGSVAEVTTTTLEVPRTKTMPWGEEVLGSYGLQMRTREHGFEPGTTYSYETFYSQIEAPSTWTREVIGLESVELLDGETRRLHHIIARCVTVPGDVARTWCDEQGHVFKYERVIGESVQTWIRTTEERARKVEQNELVVDTSEPRGFPCDVLIHSLAPVDSILYRLQVRDESVEIPESLGDDPRQKVLENDGQGVLVLVKRTPRPPEQPLIREGHPEELAEFLEPNPFIQSDHAGLRAKALEVVGDETDAWEAARQLARFVRGYVESSDRAVDYASAGRVFETRRGDCTECAVLLAAMARAVGLPSRIATGFIYFERAISAHAWTELRIGDEWYALDATRLEGRVGPEHLRISAESHGEESKAQIWKTELCRYNLEPSIQEFTCGERMHSAENGFRTRHVEGSTYRNSLYGISLRKPEGHQFDRIEPDPEAASAAIVALTGQPVVMLIAAGLEAEPVYRASLERGGFEIQSSVPQRIAGRNGTAYTAELDGTLFRLHFFSDDRVSFTLLGVLEDLDRDLAVFQEVADSVVLE